MDFSLDASEKIISLIAGLIAIVTFLFFRSRTKNESPSSQSHLSNNTQNVTVHVAPAAALPAVHLAPSSYELMSVVDLKKSVRVLFIDDDREFKIVSVLKKMGWEHTKIVSDVSSLEIAAVTDANVIFVDIQGVGKIMRYSDEGLGLALAIKRRHPGKKVVIYSAHEEGSRFHEALQEADYSLPKTADPIRFEETIVRVLRK